MARTAKAKQWPGSSKSQTWQEWKDLVWSSMTERFGYPGLAALEQYMHRSAYEKRCVECGDPGVAEQESQIIASIKTYWFCQECSDYWTERGAREQASAPAKRQRRKKSQAAA
jgi:hypothetical protein